MDSDQYRKALVGVATVMGAASLLGSMSGCASDPRRFRLAAPVTRDQDLDLVSVACKPDPASKDPEHIRCAPKPYESSFAWDAADNTVFRPVSKFFQVDPEGEAENVNALDEVPDSSWFVNRMGREPMTPSDVARGYCVEGSELRSNPEKEAWVIDHGKDNGANPGFRILVNGTKFMLKTDDTQPERATAATAISTRLYYAAGWWAPCDSVVYFSRQALKLKPGLTVKANVGGAHPFDEKALDKTLEGASRRGENYRAVASRWLPGDPLGPFTYEGRRKDDPSDVINHENRRDLRGAKVIAAWLNHFDTREQNTMSTWMASDEKNPRSQGYVRHWYIDLGDSFGSEWTVDGFSRRHGHSYLFDAKEVGFDFVTLGLTERPWDHAKRTPGAETFGYFTARDFEPATWKGEYPNPSFGRMTELDGAWAARIIARFTPDHVAAAVGVGEFTDPKHTEFLTNVLLQRQRIILDWYLARRSPVADVTIEQGKVCALDLARWRHVFPDAKFQYKATVRRGTEHEVAVAVTAEDKGRICVNVGNNTFSDGVQNDAIPRYTVLRISNGASKGPLLVHMYDLGPTQGLALAGIERPEN